MKKTLKSLLKSKTKVNKDWRLVGFYASPDVRSQLILIALGLEETQSDVLRTIVLEFLSKTDAVKVAASQIKRTLAKDPDFKKRLEKFLRDKKLTKKYINEILKALKYE